MDNNTQQPFLEDGDRRKIIGEIAEKMESLIFSTFPSVYDDDLLAMKVDMERAAARRIIVREIIPLLASLTAERDAYRLALEAITHRSNSYQTARDHAHNALNKYPSPKQPENGEK